MTMTDPIADMLTRIRNAIRARKEDVRVPSSSIKLEIARILKEEGYVKDYSVVEEDKKKLIRVVLKYGPQKRSIITEIQRGSKPGLRIYVGKGEIPRVLGGIGVAIVSTSRGVMTDKKARELGVGGEVICTVY